MQIKTEFEILSVVFVHVTKALKILPFSKLKWEAMNTRRFCEEGLSLPLDKWCPAELCDKEGEIIFSSCHQT